MQFGNGLLTCGSRTIVVNKTSFRAELYKSELKKKHCHSTVFLLLLFFIHTFIDNFPLTNTFPLNNTFLIYIANTIVL